MNKKVLKYIIVVTLLSIVGYMGYAISSNLKHKAETAERLSTLPDFTFQTLYDNEFKSTELPNLPVVIIFFRTTCDHCQYEVKDILNVKEAFQNFKVIMVSEEELEEIKNFIAEYKLSDLTFMTFLRDSKMQFKSIFGTNTVPSIFIYDQNKKLKKIFVGETQVGAILKYLIED